MSLESWQWNNFANLKDKQLNRIVLPGSHDSGAYKGSLRFDLTPASGPKILGSLIKSFPGQLIHSYLDGFATCQDKNIYNQLKSGIRVFDWRICISDDRKIRLHHTFMADTLDNIMEQYIQFFKEHPNEFVTIRYSSQGCKNKYKSEKYKWGEEVKAKTEFNKLVDWNAENRPYKRTYQDMITNNKNIIFILNNYSSKKVRVYGKVYNRASYDAAMYGDVNTAAKHAEHWLSHHVPYLYMGNKYSTYNCNITPSNILNWVINFICYAYPILSIICSIILIWRLFKITKSTKSTKNYLIKFLTDPFIIIAVIILISTFNGYYHYKVFGPGIQNGEPYNQNKMIDVLKKNETLAKKLSAVSMDFPTAENIRWIISLNE